ncbi:MAG: C40 family peptidase [Arenimonas sp.]|jgi:cell wall-associated NlpC family hydrolase
MKVAHYPQPASPAPVGVRLAALTLASLLLGACASSGPERSHSRPQQRYGEPTALSARSNEVLIRAIGLVGTPYRYGGNTPEGGFDCSGLVDFVFLDAAGLRLPRSTRALIDFDAPRVRRDKLQPGDLLFFSPGGGKASHIGIYVGEGRFVHAPSAGGTVRLDVLETEYWQRAYVDAKRVLR